MPGVDAPATLYPQLYATSSKSISQAGGMHIHHLLPNLCELNVTLLGESLVSNVYGNRVAQSIATELPDHAWQPWKFQRTMNKWWEDLSAELNQRNPLAEAIARDYLSQPSPHSPTRTKLLYKLLQPNRTRSSKRVVEKSNKVVDFALPEHRYKYMQEFAPKSWSSLYNLSTFDLQDHRGKYYTLTSRPVDLSYFAGVSLLAVFHNSPSLAVMTENPAHHWLPWKFTRTPQSWWNRLVHNFRQNDPVAREVARHFIEELERKLKIKSPSDWSQAHLHKLGIADRKRLAGFGKHTALLQSLYDMQFVKSGKGSRRKESVKQTQRRVNSNIATFFERVV